MFEFLPDWFKSIIGSGLMVAIAVAGFSLTSKSKGSSKSSSSTKSSLSKETEK